MAATQPMIARAKPLAGQSPDLLHPFASGLVHAFMFNEGSGRMVTDCVSGKQGFFRNGTPVWVPTAFGGGVRFNGSSDIGNFTYNQSSGSVPFSVIAGVRVESIPGFGTIWANGGVGLYTTSSAGGKFIWFNILTGSTVIALNTPIVIGASASPTLVSLVMNGVADGFVNSGIPAAIDPASTIGGHGGEYFNGDISFLYVYNRYIPPEMMACIQADPFAMFEEAEYARRITFIGAAVSHAAIPVASTFPALTVAP